jgi:hypothetical protein
VADSNTTEKRAPLSSWRSMWMGWLRRGRNNIIFGSLSSLSRSIYHGIYHDLPINFQMIYHDLTITVPKNCGCTMILPWFTRPKIADVQVQAQIVDFPGVQFWLTQVRMHLFRSW